MKVRAILRTAVFASLFIFAGASLAQEPSTGIADLSDQFPSAVDIEQGGGTCTLYSSADLVGAACYRRIGRHVDFSKRALYVQYLHALLTGPFRGSHLLPTPGSGELTDLEGTVRSDWALGDLVDGRDCYSESAEPFSPDFTENMQHIIQAYGEEEAQKLANLPGRKDLDSGLAREAVSKQEWLAADGSLQFYFGAYLTNPGSDPDIRSCLQARPPMKVVLLNKYAEVPVVDSGAINKELGRGFPVLCETHIKYSNGVQGTHALVIAGLRTGTDGKNEYLIRDPNFSDPRWEVAHNYECFYAWVVR